MRGRIYRRDVLPMVVAWIALTTGCDRSPTGGGNGGQAKISSAEVPSPPDAPGIEEAVAARIREMRQACLAKPNAAATWGRLGIVFDVHDFLAEAIQCYERASELAPRDFRWPYFLGFCYRDSNQEQSFANFKQALQLNPRHAPLHIRLGLALTGLNRVDEARGHYGRALELEPESAFAYLGLARLALLDGELQASLDHLVQAAALEPRMRDAHTLQAQVYRSLGDTEAAERAAARAAAVKHAAAMPDTVRDPIVREGVSARWHARRGYILQAAGHYDRAIVEFRQALAIHPDSAVQKTNLAAALTKAGQLAEAIELYESALAAQPLPPDTLNRLHFNYGLALVGLQRIRQAIEHFEKALAADPSHAAARYHLGASLVRAGRYDEAIGHLRTVAKLMPEKPEICFKLGMVLAHTGQDEEAAAWFRRVLENEPEHLSTMINLGAILARSGRPQDAVPHFQKAIELEPGDADAHYYLGVALGKTGLIAEAIQAFRQGLMADPNHREMANNLAWHLATSSLEHCRNGAEAVEVAERLCLVTQRRDLRSLDTLAAAYAETAQYAKAVATANEALAVLRAALRKGAGTVEEPDSDGPVGAPGEHERSLLERLARYEAGQPYHEAP